MYADTLSNIYLDWVNNFISLEGFASYYCLTIDQAQILIDLGQSCYNSLADNVGE